MSKLFRACPENCKSLRTRNDQRSCTNSKQHTKKADDLHGSLIEVLVKNRLDSQDLYNYC